MFWDWSGNLFPSLSPVSPSHLFTQPLCYSPECSHDPSPRGKLFFEPLLKSGEWVPLFTLICSSPPTPVLTGVELDGRCHCDISVPSSNVLCWEEAGGFLKSGIQPALTWSNISRTWVGNQTRNGVPKDGAIWGRTSKERCSLKNLEAREKCWGLENAELRSIHIPLAASARP